MGNFDRRGPRDFDKGFSYPRREPRERHKAICTKCKKECEVPFQPKEGRDVFCDGCWRERRFR